jgi:hypothetical protein
MAQLGLIVMWDGSVHRCLGMKQPPCCLISAVNDATGTPLCARFFLFEAILVYLWSLRTILDTYGIPLTIYQARHGSLHRNDPHWPLEEQLAGRQFLPKQDGPWRPYAFAPSLPSPLRRKGE